MTSFKKAFVRVSSLLLMLLFLYAAVSKLMDYQKFLSQLSKSPLVGEYASILVLLVPTIEIAITVMLAFRTTSKFGLYLSYGLMLLFTGYIFAILLFAYNIPCSCGGILNKMGWPEHLAFNILFTAIAALSFLWSNSKTTKLNSKKFFGQESGYAENLK